MLSGMTGPGSKRKLETYQAVGSMHLDPKGASAAPPQNSHVLVRMCGKLQEPKSGRPPAGMEASGMKAWITPPGKEPRRAVMSTEGKGNGLGWVEEKEVAPALLERQEQGLLQGWVCSSPLSPSSSSE